MTKFRIFAAAAAFAALAAGPASADPFSVDLGGNLGTVNGNSSFDGQFGAQVTTENGWALSGNLIGFETNNTARLTMAPDLLDGMTSSSMTGFNLTGGISDGNASTLSLGVVNFESFAEFEGFSLDGSFDFDD